MITTKKSVSVEVDFATMKKLGRASKALSELASAIVQATDSAPLRPGRAASR